MNCPMNRFITYARKAPNVPFHVAIYRDDRAYSGYGAIAWSNIRIGRVAHQITQDSLVYSPKIRKLS
jgi:hypothetical protein